MSTYLYSMSRKKEKEIVRGVTVESVGAEGKAVARIDGKVVFVSNAVPGEIHGGHFGWDSDSLAGPSAALLRALSGLRGLCLAGTPYHAAQVQAAAGRGPFLPHRASGQFLQNQKQDGRIVPQPTAKLHLQYSR